MSEPTRSEHLEWCKKRAIEILDTGDLGEAVASMISDLRKHPGTRPDPFISYLGILEAQSKNPERVRSWITGFN